MEVIERINMVELLTRSIKESLREYNGIKIDRGMEYALEHSAASIQDRCRVARRELLLIMKELNKCY